MVQIIMANFFASRLQYWNALAVTRLQDVIAVHIDYFEMKTNTLLPLPQSGKHILTKMAILPAVYNQHGRIRGGRFTCYRHRSLSW